MTETLLLQNARLIDGLDDQPHERVSILVTGQRIRDVTREVGLDKNNRRWSCI